MYKDSKIYIAGHTGMLGSALLNKLRQESYTNIIFRTHNELELTDRSSVELFFQKERPKFVFLCAGLTGGITANKTYPAHFMHINISIQDNIFEAAQRFSVEHLIFYGSSCIYPKYSKQPIKEECLLTGMIEETSEAYALAKMTGVIACRAYNKQYNTNRFIVLVPATMYGPNDNFSLQNSHVLSALIRKFYEAKLKYDRGEKEPVVLWGSGKPKREFIFVDDVADASIFAINNTNKFKNHHYNIGTGSDYPIKELAEKISSIVGYKGRILWDINKPDGTMRKLLDSGKFFSFGWKPNFTLDEGLKLTYMWVLENENVIRGIEKDEIS